MTDPNENWRHKVTEQPTDEGLDETICSADLSGWKDLGGHLAGLIAAEMDSMTDTQLADLGAIHKHATESNCWYVVLGIAPAVATLAHQLLQNRRRPNSNI
jgi:hypothetical protein